MSRNAVFSAAAVVCMANGLFNAPLIKLFLQPVALFFSYLAPNISFALFLTSLMVSTFTLAVSGIPAALYERIAGRPDTDVVSAFIWLAGAVILSMPALLRIFVMASS